MSTLRVVEKVEQPALICKKCDRCLVGGTLPGRYTLCGGCATADARPRVNRYMKRSRRQKRIDHFLDRYLGPSLRFIACAVVAVAVGYWFARAMGWTQ